MGLENINNLPSRRAERILLSYSGANNYILSVQRKANYSKYYRLTNTQVDYILRYHTTKPIVARKWVDLDSYFAKKYMEDKKLISIPNQLYIEKLLVQTEKAYHVWGKFFETDNLEAIWVPKSAIPRKSQKERIVEIDFDKYSHRPALEHQKPAIKKLVGNDKFILADDMGLGKTTSAVIASVELQVKKILIICPASLKINWKREVENYTNKSISIIEGQNWESAEYIIINYEILKNFHTLKRDEESIILNENFDLVIIDEAHYIKNSNADRTKLCNSIIDNIGKVWLLTGTPITSRPIDYYNLLSKVSCPVADNWRAYVIRYCKGYQFTIKTKNKKKRKIWNTSGASNLDELRNRTKTHILRRLKTDVLDLPEKITTPIYQHLKSKEYEEIVGEYYDWLENSEDNTSLTVQLSKLMSTRLVIAEEKVPTTIELAENAIEQGKKVIIFTNFTNPLNRIKNHFKNKAVKLDGSMTKYERQHSVDEFQNNEKVMIFVGNIKAAGVGITLTAGDVVIMNDLSFVPSDHSQAEDRAYRYGQENSVLVYYPIFENTIEMIIYNMLKEKKNIVETVMGDNINNSDSIIDIMKEINQKTI